ncbi:GNAT family N-acetyltransferase [uncultured Hyphomonas sp.]|uniref:GNAT family N-acetyltransferase n=1 Tax=uncultured Hyphomonas sp. TaxID=225298 RepID=UPI00261E1CD1|nr:GNAT family N-acetyltransferase [uncultured Hyphomonas sp.]
MADPRFFQNNGPFSLKDLAAFISADLVLSKGGDAERLVQDVAPLGVAGETDILTIATDPHQRRKGLAGRLISALVKRVGERGVTRIMLDVAEDNLPARELYRAHGFAEDGRRPRYYRAARNVPVDAILMSRSLSL